MSSQRTHGLRPRSRRRLTFNLEVLETRSLLSVATETFSGPSLTDLIQLAREGQNTAPAGISRMLQSLQTQLESGPLADLNSGAASGNDFVVEVQNLETSFEQNVDAQLSPAFPNVDELLKLQGQRIVADVTALNQQSSVGLISSSALATEAQTAIGSLTAGPITSLSTTLGALASTTTTFESDLSTLAQGLGSSTTSTLSTAQAASTVTAEAEAYRATMHAALQVTHPNLSSAVDSAVNALETTAGSLATSSAPASLLTSAITTFDAAVLDTSGLFGPQGPVSQRVSGAGVIPPGRTAVQSGTAMSSVSGTASSGGTATLTATLATDAGQALSGEAVNFTLDGAFVGSATTDSNGVATLTGVTTTDASGTDTGGVYASFAGDINNQPSHANGDLTVGQASGGLSNVSGSAAFGGPATLTATLTDPTTSQPVSGATVSFTLDGTSVGTALTNSSGVATLTGVTTTDAAGTDTGGVVASFAGNTNLAAASNATGNLVVAQAPTTLSAVSGTAPSGGPATLTATLMSTVTNQGVSGATVAFTLDGTSVGSAVTGSNGVATLTGVPTSDASGTDTGGVVAAFAGDANHAAASNAAGNLVVS